MQATGKFCPINVLARLEQRGQLVSKLVRRADGLAQALRDHEKARQSLAAHPELRFLKLNLANAASQVNEWRAMVKRTKAELDAFDKGSN